MEEKKWTWHVPTREEKLKYTQHLLKFMELVEKVSCENEKFKNSPLNLTTSRVETGSEARSSTFLPSTLAKVNLPLLEPNSEEDLNSDVYADFQNELNLEDSELNIFVQKIEADFTEEAKAEEIGRGEPEVKKARKESKFYWKNLDSGMCHCRRCHKIYSTTWGVVAHFEADHLQKRYKCDICNEAVYRYEASLKVHQRECRGKEIPPNWVSGLF